MARRGRVRGKRARSGPTLIGRIWQIGAFVVLAAIVYSAWLWIDMQSWRPDPAVYAEQGAVIASDAGPVRFETLEAIGADFIYLELAAPDEQPAPDFARKVEQARAAGLEVGVLLPVDPCLRADPHSARFTQMVPRDVQFLPPAIELAALPNRCLDPVSEAAVTSEIITLINQVESHAGERAILKLGEAFEMKYRLANRIDRDLWLMRDRSAPRYAGRPWLLWSANSQLDTQALAQSVEWVVVQK